MSLASLNHILYNYISFNSIYCKDFVNFTWVTYIIKEVFMKRLPKKKIKFLHNHQNTTNPGINLSVVWNLQQPVSQSH